MNSLQCSVRAVSGCHSKLSVVDVEIYSEGELFNQLHLADKKNNVNCYDVCSIPVNWCQITQNLTEHLK